MSVLSAVLVWAEHDNTVLKDATLAAVTAAGQLGGDVHLLVAGKGAQGVADAAAKVAGVAKVLLADDAAYENALAENVAPLVAALMAGYDAFVAPATTRGKNIAPRLETLKVVEPSKRQAGIKVGSVDELVAKLKTLGVVA